MTHKILFIKPTDSPFINIDQKILEKYFDVKPFLIGQGESKYKYYFRLLAMTCFIFANYRRSKFLVAWFGDYHSAIMVLIGKILNKPTVIFAGGQEAVCYKELGKGVYIKSLRATCVRYALRNASIILPNHKSLLYHENFFYNPENPHIDGILHYVKNIKGKIAVIPNGVDAERVKYNSSIAKQNNLVLSVAAVRKMIDFINKGFDIFIEVAKKNPDLEFVIVFITEPVLSQIEEKYEMSKLSNLKIVTQRCSDQELSEYFNKAKVYVQVSITEGMPNSLAEAMLCECIPVGSNVNGIPDAIGDTGIIIKNRSVDELSQAIRQAIKMDSGKQAREHTLQNFSITNRETKLMEVLKEFL